MEEKQMSEKESLLLIQQMIHTAKREQKDDGMGWILWGWLLFAASVLTILNLNFRWFDDLFIFWNAFGVVTFIVLVWETVRNKFQKKERVKTYTADLFNKLNVGFFISLVFIILAINIGARQIYDNFGRYDGSFVRIGFALLINLYSFWILIYGTALNFKPSVIGAYISWAFGITALFVSTFEQVMMLHAAAVLVGYIIPGHIANREFKKLRREDKAVQSV
jgi:MFS family permease